MLTIARNPYEYRELVATLAWKHIAVRCKQAALGLAWAGIKPPGPRLIVTLVKSFLGIGSGRLPCPVLTVAARVPWIFLQASARDAI